MSDHRDLINAFFAGCNGHEPARVASLYAPDGSHEDVATGHSRSGHDALEQGLSHFLKTIPDAHWEESQRIVAGKATVVSYVLTGHLQADLGPFKARGQAVSLPGVYVVTCKDDKITSSRDYWDAADFGRQVR